MNNVFDLLHLRRNASDDGCSRPVGRPRRDWMLICIVCGSILLAGVLFDVWMYISVTENLTSSSSSAETLGPSAAQLQQTLSEYDALAAEHAALLAKEPTVVDPSKAR